MTKKKQQRKKKAPQAKKKPKRHPGKGTNRGSSIPFANNSMPRPYHRVNSRDDVMVVTGMEILDALCCRTGPAQSYLLLNPGQSDYFKRLSTTAAGYEKFRFKKVQLEYYPECPVTRTGIVSACLLHDPLIESPAEPQGFMAFKESFTGPVYKHMKAVIDIPADKKWYLNSSAASVDATDPTTRFQGRIVWQSEGSNSADNAMIAGYVALHYVCELTDHRPMRDAVVAGVAEPGQVFTGGTVVYPDNNVITADILNMEGSFDLRPDMNEKKGGYDTGTSFEDSWTSYLFEHMVDYYFPIAGTAIDGKELEHKRVDIKPSVVLGRRSDKHPWVLTVGGVAVDELPKWCELWQKAPSHEEKDSLLRATPIRDLRLDRSYTLKGNTAGDVSIQLVAHEPDATTTVLSTQVISSGTGSFTAQGTIPYNETKKGRRLSLAVVPTGVETRAMLTGAYWDYHDLNGSHFG